MSTENRQFLAIPIIALPHWLKQIEAGLTEAIDESFNETNLASMAELLFKGKGQLWIVVDDGQYAGFWITEIAPSATRTWLYVAFGYSVPEYRSVSLLRSSFNHFETFAKSLPNCDGVRLMSAHDNYSVLTSEKFGYKQRFVEYVKEFNDGEDEG